MVLVCQGKHTVNSGSPKIVNPITDERTLCNFKLSVSYPFYPELINHVINLSFSHSKHDLTVLTNIEHNE